MQLHLAAAPAARPRAAQLAESASQLVSGEQLVCAVADLDLHLRRDVALDQPPLLARGGITDGGGELVRRAGWLRGLAGVIAHHRADQREARPGELTPRGKPARERADHLGKVHGGGAACHDCPHWMAPLISILMPVRDAEATLAAALESIRRQRGVTWECVAVDDGSQDASRRCLERARDTDPRVRVLAQPPRGIVAALEHGLQHCRGQFVARMDADDLMARDRLRLQAEALERDSGLAAVGCHVRMFPRRQLSPQRRAYESWLNAIRTEADLRREAFVECPLAHPSLMLRRSVLERHRYRECGWPEDYDLLSRLLESGERLGVVPRRLLSWRDGPSRLSRTSKDYAIESFIACKAHFLARGLLRERPAYVLWGYGATGRSLSRALERHGKRPVAIVEVHPGRLGQRIRGVPVIAPSDLTALMAREGQPPIVASVARAGPRSEVRAALRALGFTELRDFVCAA